MREGYEIINKHYLGIDYIVVDNFPIKNLVTMYGYFGKNFIVLDTTVAIFKIKYK